MDDTAKTEIEIVQAWAEERACGSRVNDILSEVATQDLAELIVEHAELVTVLRGIRDSLEKMSLEVID